MSRTSAPGAAVRPCPLFLRALHQTGALTSEQVAWLAERWDDLPPDWAREPLMRLHQHTRAVIEHERRREGGQP